MSLLCDWQIAELCEPNGSAPLIWPFIPELVQPAVISYGPSSYGYDVRLGNRFGIYRPSQLALDPKAVRVDDLEWSDCADEFVLPAKGFVLAVTEETFHLPRNVTGLVKDKSTYARCGVHVQNTVLEAGWHGQVTLEISNYLNRPVILRVGQGIAQVLFHRGERTCDIAYGDRGGKYQGQRGVTLPTVKQ